LQRIAIEITRLERDVAGLTEELDMLKHIEQLIVETEAAYKESKSADARVRELAGLYRQVQQYQDQISQCEADLQERRQETEGLRGSDAHLEAANAELAQLNDPRSRSKTQLAIVAQEDQFTRQLQSEQQKGQETEQQLEQLQKQLAVYASLDSDIAQQEAMRLSSEEG